MRKVFEKQIFLFASFTATTISVFACRPRTFGALKNEPSATNSAGIDAPMPNPCDLTALDQENTFKSNRGETLKFNNPESKIAWEHSCFGQTYNTPNFVPNFKLYTDYGMNGGLWGKLPYWDIPAATPSLKVLEDIPEFLGKNPNSVRIYSHYLDKAGVLKPEYLSGSYEALLAKFGNPTGYIDAQMQSSLRTVLLLPEKGQPFFLKFAGDRFVKTQSSKTLTEKAVITSYLRGKRLSSNPNLLGDMSGIIWPHSADQRSVAGSTQGSLAYLAGGTQNITYRPFHLAVYKGSWKPTDHILALHVLLSQEFGESTLGKKIAGSTSEQRQLWVREKFLPMLANFIVSSVFKQGIHFEIHAQNIDLLVDGDTGEIKHFFVKDTLDSVEDPLIKLCNNFKGDALRGVRNLGWMNEVGLELKPGAAPHNVTGWYWAWFFQKTFGLFGNKDYPNTQKAFNLAPLNLWLGESIKKEFSKLLAARNISLSSLKPGASKQKLQSKDEVDVQNLITALHFLFIEAHFAAQENGFKQATSAAQTTIKQAFAKAAQNIVSTSPKVAFNPSEEKLIYGTFRGFPAAVLPSETAGRHFERISVLFENQDVQLCNDCIDSVDQIPIDESKSVEL